MLQPAGAMALFVLRLAGLLSLEESLNELQANNLTSSIYNLSDVISPGNYDPRDSVMNPTLPRELEVENVDDNTNNINGNSRIFTNSHSSQRPNLSGNSPVKSQDNRRTSNVKGRDAADWTAMRKQQLSISTGKRKGRYRNQGITSAPRASPLSDIRHLTLPPISVSDEFDNSGNNNDTNLRNVELQDSIQILSTEQSSLNQVNQINTHESREIPQINSSDSHQNISFVDRSQPNDGISESNSHTEKIVDETLVTTNSVKAVPVAKISVVQENDNEYQQQRERQSHKRHNPHMEAIAEGEALFDDVHEHHLVGLEAPPDTFVGKDFEYYDFRNSDHNNDRAAPSLSSRSLVSAVPLGRLPRLRQNKEATKEEEPTIPKRKHGIPPARPVPRPRLPADTTRVFNNPYPYGPKILPSPYNPPAPYSPPAPYDPMGRDRNGEREPEPSPEYDYEDYYDYEHIDNEEKYTVHTSEPTVLFHFEKPGYNPEAPTTVLPPTRAPTPSDPWDCAPRCPTYTLLDWNTNYDVRLYPKTMWVSTVIISENRVLAELEGYMRVQDYFYGLNDKGLVLNLTVPFVTQIKFGKHPGVLDETNDYTISLYIPPRYYEYYEPPTPISNEVLLDELEEKTVFVHSFEANVWDVTEGFLKDKANTLMNQLRKNGEAFLDRYYYLASYSRPELYQPVYYELWVYATNFRDPQTTGQRISPNRLPLANKITEKTLNKLCRGVECPSFEVLRTYKYGIQKRRYYDGLFASTSPGECEYSTMSVWKGFMPLHLYKHGINSHMEVIEATRPIALVHIIESTEPNTECPQNMTMSLYLPRRLHSNPPVTGYAAPNVRITEMEDVIVYAYTVGGYLLDPMKMRKELADMKYRLSEFGACYKDHDYYIVVYDFIVRYHGRQNEIWIVAENCKATHNG